MVETTVLEDVQTYVAPVSQADVKKRKINIDAVPTKFSHRFQPLPEEVVQAKWSNSRQPSRKPRCRAN